MQKRKIYFPLTINCDGVTMKEVLPCWQDNITNSLHSFLKVLLRYKSLVGSFVKLSHAEDFTGVIN